jgi:hypothetical protein
MTRSAPLSVTTSLRTLANGTDGRPRNLSELAALSEQIERVERGLLLPIGDEHVQPTSR